MYRKVHIYEVQTDKRLFTLNDKFTHLRNNFDHSRELWFITSNDQVQIWSFNNILLLH